MDEIKEKPCESEINSLRVLNALRSMKKRKFQAEQLGLPIPKHKCCDRPSSSVDSIKDSNSLTTHDSDSSASIHSDAPRTCSSSSAVKALDDTVDPQSLLNLEEHLLEFGDQTLDHCSDKELQDFLCSNGLNSNVYVLSSGRWSVNQEAQSGTRKPTIDQEFEQYFSMLML